MTDIWILGAAGRSGSAVAHNLAARGASLVLVGRDEVSLQALAARIGGSSKVVVTKSTDEITQKLRQAGDAVIVNLIGPFAQTALPLINACKGSYVDISNELSAIRAVLNLHSDAVASNRTLVCGAGWGVLGTESVVLKMCADRRTPSSVRVDTVPFVNSPGRIGPTLAATIVDGLPEGGWCYDNGALVRVNVGSSYEKVVLPDGSTTGTGAVPFGDLEAAQRASGAPSVVAASTAVPASPLVRAVMPAAIKLFSLKAIREFAKQRIANLTIPPAAADKPRTSWARARINYPDGSVCEGWLRAGDGMDFTARSVSEIAFRLAQGGAQNGAFTPGALFGPDLALTAGGEFMMAEARPS